MHFGLSRQGQGVMQGHQMMYNSYAHGKRGRLDNSQHPADTGDMIVETGIHSDCTG